MSTLKRYNGTSWETISGNITGDTLPIGSEVDYDGANVPAGWQEVDDPNTYSTTETRIGTWIDGKPIYRKIYTNVNITTSNTDLINISGLGIASVVKIYGAIFTTSNNTFPVPLMDNSSTNYSVIFATASALRGRAIIGSGNLSSCWIAIEYTKTTD